MKEANNTWEMAKGMGVNYEKEEIRMISRIKILEGRDKNNADVLGRGHGE